MTDPTIETIDLLIQKYAASMMVSPESLTFKRSEPGGDYMDPLADHVIYSLVRKVATIESRDELRLPKTWLDAFIEQNRHHRGWRGRVARWAEVRHPVEYQTWRASEVLPLFPVLDKYRNAQRIYTWKQTGGWND